MEKKFSQTFTVHSTINETSVVNLKFLSKSNHIRIADMTEAK